MSIEHDWTSGRRYSIVVQRHAVRLGQAFRQCFKLQTRISENSLDFARESTASVERIITDVEGKCIDDLPTRVTSIRAAWRASDPDLMQCQWLPTPDWRYRAATASRWTVRASCPTLTWDAHTRYTLFSSPQAKTKGRVRAKVSVERPCMALRMSLNRF